MLVLGIDPDYLKVRNLKHACLDTEIWDATTTLAQKLL